MAGAILTTFAGLYIIAHPPVPPGNALISGASGESCGSSNDVECKQLVQQINTKVDELKRRYYQIIENSLDLPPSGPNSVGGHQEQFGNQQVRLRRLLNEAAAKGCTGYAQDAWDWASRPASSPPEYKE